MLLVLSLYILLPCGLWVSLLSTTVNVVTAHLFSSKLNMWQYIDIVVYKLDMWQYIDILVYKLDMWQYIDIVVYKLDMWQYIDMVVYEWNTFLYRQGYSGPVGPAGHFEWIPIQNASNLREMMGSYYLNYPQSVSRSVSFTLPFVDSQHGKLVVYTESI